MTLQPFGKGAWFPDRLDESASINVSTYLIDATGEIAAIATDIEKDGTLVGMEFYVAAVANAIDNGIRGSIQGVDGATSLNDGVIAASGTTGAGTPSAVGHVAITFGTPLAVTQGQQIAAVVDIPSFTAGDSFAVGGHVMSSDQGFPYGISATSTRQTNLLPGITLKYDDGTYQTCHEEVWPATAITAVSFDTADTPDEFGLKVRFAAPIRFKQLSAAVRPTSGTAGSTYALVVYDAANAVLASKTIDCDIASVSNTLRLQQHRLLDDVEFAAGQDYRIVVQALHGTIVVQVAYSVFPSLAIMEGVVGANICATQRTNAGAWTNFDNVTDGFWLARIALRVTAIDDGAGGGGAAGYSRGRVVNQ